MIINESPEIVISRIKNTKGLSASESQIAELIDAAYQYGIVEWAWALDSAHYEIKIVDTDPYVVSFGRDPDRRKYDAERAQRASALVEALTGKIGAEYNCFIVPTDDVCEPPTAEQIRKRLFSGNVTVGNPREGKSVGFGSTSSAVYELEVTVIAAIGDKYLRVNDSVLVNRKGDKIEYEYRHLTRHSSENIKEHRFDVEKSRRTVTELLKPLCSPRANEEKKRILSVISAAKDSVLNQRLRELELTEKDFGSVGQISLSPCAVYVDMIPEKNYSYEITAGKSSGRLLLKWGKRSADFEQTPLYPVLASDGSGRLVGLSDKGEGEPISDGDKLVFVSHVESFDLNAGKVSLTEWLSILPKPHENVADSYKGVRSYAVLVDEISPHLNKALGKRYGEKGGEIIRLYPRSDAVLAKGKKLRLGADFDICPLSDDSTKEWIGGFTMEQLPYLDKKTTTLRRGYISQSRASSGYLHHCDWCNSFYYSRDDASKNYRRKHLLLDKSCGCESCFAMRGVVNLGGSKHPVELVRGVKCNDKLGTSGSLFVNKRQNGELLPLDEGGNAFSCCHCGDMIYVEDASTVKKCYTCARPICADCYRLASSMPEYRLLDGGWFCKACGAQSNICGTGKTVYRGVYNSAENSTGNIVDFADGAKATKLFFCAECDYKNAKLVYDKDAFPCDVCGRLISSVHKNSPTLKSSLLAGKKICYGCRDEETIRAKAQIQSCVDERKALENQLSDLERETVDFMVSLQKDVRRNVLKYVPYMNFIDRIKILSEYKRLGDKFVDGGKESCFTVRAEHPAGKGFGNTAKIVIEMKSGRKYLYYYVDGRITFEEVW